MEKEEFKKIILRRDRKYGNLKKTIRMREKRNYFIDKAPQIVMDFVEELLNRGLDIMIYEFPYKKNDMFICAYIKKYHILVASTGSKAISDHIFKSSKKTCYPFFLDQRKNDLAWEIEKLDNCIKEAEDNPKAGLKRRLVIDESIQRKRVKISKL